MSYKLGQELNIPAFFVNPMPTDELCDMARVTGIPGIYRPAKSHPLNQKQVAIHHSELMGKNMKTAIISSCIWAAVPALLHMKKEK